jgi:pterin-4a-carbinolamine dehydratase
VKRLTYPIITFSWKSVNLSLKPFDMDAITKRDIALASEIEKNLKGNNKIDQCIKNGCSMA